MISPQNRLIFYSGIIIIPFTLTAAVLPATTLASFIVVLSFIAIAIADGVFSLKRLDGVSIELPEVIRLSKDREGSIVLSMLNKSAVSKTIKVGLALPRDISSPNEFLAAELPQDRIKSVWHWPCTAYNRGRYVIKHCYLETASLLGFWAIRSAVKATSEIRVYPNLLSEKRNLAALFLNRGNFGVHPQRQVGRGREFEKLREYIHGDSFDGIHWKATAKRGRPITKVYQVERTQEVYIIIDSSRLSRREVEMPLSRSLKGARNTEAVLDRFITSSLLLGIASEQQGDRFGILNFSDRVNNFIRAKSGRTHYNHCRDTLYSLNADTVNPDFDELGAFISMKLRKRALLVFMTSLDDPVLAESFVKNMALVCRKHLVLVNMIKPHGVDPMFSQPDISSAYDIYKNLGGHILLNNLLELKKVLKINGIRFNLLNSDKMCLELVTQYINIKQRQIL